VRGAGIGALEDGIIMFITHGYLLICLKNIKEIQKLVNDEKKLYETFKSYQKPSSTCVWIFSGKILKSKIILHCEEKAYEVCYQTIVSTMPLVSANKFQNRIIIWTRGKLLVVGAMGLIFALNLDDCKV
jgi:hypothetical protein